MKKFDILVHNIASLYTNNPTIEGAEGPLGLIKNATVGFKDGKISYIGPNSENFTGDVEIDGSNQIGTPGLVDCHTHSVWAGSRADEFARRLAGESYVSILEQGGGILSTVKNTRNATLEELVNSCHERVVNMRNTYGVTTVEIKSGYGLNAETELKMLTAATKSTDNTIRVIKTFLGAHTIPSDFKNKRDIYVEDVVKNQLPKCAPVADCIDIFCDRGAFTLEEAKQILQAGKALGLKVRAHAEQIESSGCAKLVAELGGTSADHLEQLGDDGIEAMAKNNVVAVLLPGAQLYLKDKSPPVEKLRKAGVKMAVATDLNPGSSPVHSLWICASLSCVLQGLTTDEAFLGITKNAGLALGRKDLGWLDCEKSVGDLVLFSKIPGEAPVIEPLIQHMGTHVSNTVIIDGKLMHHSSDDTNKKRKY